MHKIVKEATEETPQVILDAENNHIKVVGRSLPEDAEEFYRPLIDWVKEYKQNPNDKTEVNIQLEYFNTSSSKMIMDFLIAFEGLQGKGHQVTINWYVAESDKDMQQAVEELSELVDLPFELHRVSEE